LRDRSFKEFALYILKLTKGFIVELFEPKVSFYAASMSWSTLFFMIPLLVIILSIVIYTPIFNQFYSNIHSIIANSVMPGSSKQIMEWIDSFVANAASMGVIGFIYIVVAAVMFFRDFDYIVNDIFDKSRRTLLEALIVYGGMLIFIPLSLGGTIWLFTKIDNTLHLAPQMLQFLIIWAIIFTVYKVTPAKSLFVLYLYYNKTYTTIYGAVSVALFLFLWIYISWTIFLHGMQLCSVLSNDEEE